MSAPEVLEFNGGEADDAAGAAEAESLCKACAEGDMAVVDRLAPLAHSQRHRGCMPLHYAAMARSLGAESAVALLRAKANVAATTDDSKQAIHLAAENPRGEAVLRALLEAGASADAPTLALRTPLHHAAVEGVTETARILLEVGANVNAMNSCGAIPLHWAAKTGKRELVEMLVQARSDLQVMDNLGRRPAEMAMDNRQEDVGNFLLALEAKL